MSQPIYRMGLAFQLTQLLIYLLLQSFMLAAADSKGKDQTGGFIKNLIRDFSLIVCYITFP